MLRRGAYTSPVLACRLLQVSVSRFQIVGAASQAYKHGIRARYTSPFVSPSLPRHGMPIFTGIRYQVSVSSSCTHSVQALHLIHDSIGTDAVRQCHDGSIPNVNSSYRPWNDAKLSRRRRTPPPSWHADSRCNRHPDNPGGMPSPADAIIVAG